MSPGILSSISVSFCLFLLANGAPQRSIQLGGTGPRPVALGAPNPGANYQQQLAFGPPQPQPQPQQRVRGQTPVLLQQGGLNGFQGQPPIGSFPIPSNRQQPIILRSPPVQAQAQPQGAAEEEEYDDEEYEEAAPAPKPIPTAAPIQQRAPVRVVQAQPQYQPVLSQPQRFAVPQQQQPQQQQPQPQPQQRRVVQQQRPVSQAPVVQQYQPAPQLQQQPQPRPINQQQQRQQLLGQDSRIGGGGKDRGTATPPPIQTVDRFNRQNEDGSITWGYVNEDGTFKEETLGADCVVRGKYGYVDPDGMKREYEYQSGNPCDPNKKGQPDDDDELTLGGPSPQQQRISALVNARPVQAQGQSQGQAAQQRRLLLQQQQQQYQQ